LSTVSLTDLAVDPHPALATLREASPVAWLDELGGWIVTSRSLCVDVLTNAEVFTVDDERFSTRRVVGPSMLSLDGPAHGRHRAAFGKAFRARAVRESLETWITDLASSLVDGIAPVGWADLRGSVALPLATEVMCRILGLDVSAEQLSRWNRSITTAIDEVTEGGSVPDYGIEAFDELRIAVADSAERSSLLADAVESGLDIDEVASNVAVLLIGGVVTADGAISILFRHLLDRPSTLQALAVDPGLIPRAVDESLRLEPAAAFVDRYATRDVDLGGAHIARGDLVRVSISAANRDPVVFERPDVFDIHRPNLGDHLAFARGPHACLGIHVARLEARMALEAVLERCQDLRHPEDRGPPPTGLIFRTPETVPAVWTGDSGTIS
jgi:cytochrome P450